MHNRTLALAAFAALALSLGGCSSMQKTDGTEAPVTDATAAGAGGTGVRGGRWSGGALDDPSSPLANRVLYFEYDSAELRADSMDTVRAHGGYLASNRGTNVTVEGHADERGSREYNLALGERRAQAIKRYLEAEGVSGGQVSIISYGEERPADAGHDESAWAQNRRAVLVY
jgi:peptidoglycan-associated lipoprotein